MTWDKDKTRCEADGEYLAVFPTLESVQWLDSILQDPNIAGGKATATVDQKGPVKKIILFFLIGQP